MSVAICAYTAHCAQNVSGSLYANLHRPAVPAIREAHFLGQTVPLPYFAAFNTEKLPGQQLFALLAEHVQQAAAQAGWPLESLRDTPIFIGSASYLMPECELRLQDNSHGGSLLGYRLHSTANWLQQHFDNPNIFSFATSCTSSANALNYAFKSLEAGLCERALVLGFESFNSLTFEHFNALSLLSADSTYTPFASERGFILGEGMACFALSRESADANALIRGVAGNTDTQGLTTVSGQSLQQVMQSALNHAEVGAADIHLLKAHGVGSGTSDSAEAEAIATLYPNVPVALFKPYIGHTLGASALLETALLLDSLQQGQLPPLPHAQAYQNQRPHIAAHGLPLTNGCYQLNFFGFGGSNVSWILEWNA